MKIAWTEVAANHLAAIHAYVAASSSVRAGQLIRRIHARTAQIQQFPKSGRLTPEGERQGVREVFERPYRIMYRVKHSQVEVIAVVHMRQLQPGSIR